MPSMTNESTLAFRLAVPISRTPSMDVGVHVRVVRGQGVEDGLGLLRGCGVVQVDERAPAHLAPQNRKVGADLADVELTTSAGSHNRHASSSSARSRAS